MEEIGWNIFKIHPLQHFLDVIPSFHSLQQYSTNTGEISSKGLIREGYCNSNCVNYCKQILNNYFSRHVIQICKMNHVSMIQRNINASLEPPEHSYWVFTQYMQDDFLLVCFTDQFPAKNQYLQSLSLTNHNFRRLFLHQSPEKEKRYHKSSLNKKLSNTNASCSKTPELNCLP